MFTCAAGYLSLDDEEGTQVEENPAFSNLRRTCFEDECEIS